MNNECWALLLAAGQGSRLAAATGGEAKQFLRRNGAPLWWRAARALTASPRVRGLVVVFPPERLDAATAELADLDRDHVLGVPWRTAAGGPRRQDSVRLGLAALPAACGTVLVHDGARPFLTPALVTRVADALTDSPTIPPADGAALPFGVVPGLPVTDTIKEVDAGNRVRRTPARADLRAAQTPQAFRTAALAEAHRRAEAEGWEVTDDASLMERCGHPVAVVEGDPANRKITLPEDLALLADRDAPRPCSGWGYDVHRYGGSRPLVLGGVSIPGEWTVSAHSDGDVLLHALMDAGYADSIYGELYDKLFAPGQGSALVEAEYPDTREIMDLIHSAGGIAVLAHPGVYDSYDLMQELVESGLDGVEVWHPSHSETETAELLAFTRLHGLLSTGGSDFHGMYTRTARPLGSTSVSDEIVQSLLTYKDKRRRRNA